MDTMLASEHLGFKATLPGAYVLTPRAFKKALISVAILASGPPYETNRLWCNSSSEVIWATKSAELNAAITSSRDACNRSVYSVIAGATTILLLRTVGFRPFVSLNSTAILLFAVSR